MLKFLAYQVPVVQLVGDVQGLGVLGQRPFRITLKKVQSAHVGIPRRHAALVTQDLQ